jgi:capsular polysaccharide export protein
LFSALDSFLYFLKLGTKEETVSLFDKASLFIDKVKGKKHNFQLGVNHDLGVEYNFYPTQVTNDTQIHLNSNVNNLEALQIAIDDSNANGKKLFVKIHPAEQNVQTIRAYKDLELQQKLILVSNNTVDLIKSANKIFTINSTVGLEALIYQKDLTVLGRALYKNMTIDDVNDYIHGFLVDIDYFKTGEKFNSDIFDKLVKLANI